MTYFADLSIFPGELSAAVRHHYGIMLQENQPQLKATMGHWGFSAIRKGTTGKNVLCTQLPSCATAFPGRETVCSSCNPSHLWQANLGVCEIQAFVLLELEGEIFKLYIFNVLFKNFQINNKLFRIAIPKLASFL